MSKADANRYDAIIIGAGLGGLVCGCYLSKAGMKVLIVEQHNKPGGCCVSFKRHGLTFDAAPHCFGSYRKDGLTRKILEDLGIDKKLNIIRPDPTDTIITPDYKISFWSDIQKTIEEFCIAFPKEAENITKFFDLLLHADLHAFSRMKSWTFSNLLDKYFTNDKLKFVLAAPLLGFNGLPPSLISAFVGSKIFSEFLLDGGYYPVGGMQALPNALSEKFEELGGELQLSSLVTKINCSDGSITGVVLDDSEVIPAKYVISDCDARQTFLNLLGRENVEDEFARTLEDMVPSGSNFILYLGINKQFTSPLQPGTTICFFSHYNLEKAYQAAQEGDIENYGGFSIRVSHDGSTLGGLIPAPFKNKEYWMDNKQYFLEFFIKQIEKNLIPDLTKYITYKEAATPFTIYRYTLNYKGASYGWAGIPSQFARPGFRKPSFIQNLYLTSHWTTLGVGISGVVYFGYDTAKLIAKKDKIKI